jgi:hypothetical protein
MTHEQTYHSYSCYTVGMTHEQTYHSYSCYTV